MVNLVPVDPSTLGTSKRDGRRGRVSYPIIKMFMELNKIACAIDPASTDKNPQYLRSVLTAYVASHKLPIKIFSSNGILHLMRIDTDEDGNILAQRLPP